MCLLNAFLIIFLQWYAVSLITMQVVLNGPVVVMQNNIVNDANRSGDEIRLVTSCKEFVSSTALIIDNVKSRDVQLFLQPVQHHLVKK